MAAVCWPEVTVTSCHLRRLWLIPMLPVQLHIHWDVVSRGAISSDGSGTCTDLLARCRMPRQFCLTHACRVPLSPYLLL